MIDIYSLYDQVDEDIPVNEPRLIRVMKRYNGSRHWGFVDRQGKEVVQCKYNWVELRFICGLLKVADMNNRIGFIDALGNEVIGCQYEDATDFKDSICTVSLRKRWGGIDVQGHTIVPFVYNFLEVLGKNRLIAQDTNTYKVGLLDYQGKIVVPFIYKQLSRILSDGRIEYLLPSSEHGFMDLDGNNKEILPF